jgi:hypothetical protein
MVFIECFRQSTKNAIPVAREGLDALDTDLLVLAHATGSDVLWVCVLNLLLRPAGLWSPCRGRKFFFTRALGCLHQRSLYLSYIFVLYSFF